MPSNVAVPYMNAWVMMLTFASRIGTYSPSKYAIRSSSGRGCGAGVGASDADGCWVSIWRLQVASGADAAGGFVRSRDSSTRSFVPRPGRRGREGSADRQDPGDREHDQPEVQEVQRAADEQRATVETCRAATSGRRSPRRR